MFLLPLMLIIFLPFEPVIERGITWQATSSTGFCDVSTFWGGPDRAIVKTPWVSLDSKRVGLGSSFHTPIDRDPRWSGLSFPAIYADAPKRIAGQVSFSESVSYQFTTGKIIHQTRTVVIVFNTFGPVSAYYCSIEFADFDIQEHIRGLDTGYGTQHDEIAKFLRQFNRDRFRRVTFSALFQ